MSTSDALLQALLTRSNSQCELCTATTDLQPRGVPPEAADTAFDPDRHVLACSTCRAQLDGEVELDPRHWHGLREAIWSETPAVQVAAWRQLQKLRAEGWAQELLDQAWLADEVRAWAEAGLAADGPATVDSNGTPLQDGDSVTLIKDLDVKGAGFTAKRGTLVKKIRLTDDPGLVEGKVDRVGIYLKTEFLKKVG